MANKKEHIDEFFKGRLKGSELQLDGTEWGRLETALKEKKKRRFFWLWLAIPLALLAAWYLINEIEVKTGSKQINSADAHIEATHPEDRALKTANEAEGLLKEGTGKMEIIQPKKTQSPYSLEEAGHSEPDPGLDTSGDKPNNLRSNPAKLEANAAGSFHKDLKFSPETTTAFPENNRKPLVFEYVLPAPGSLGLSGIETTITFNPQKQKKPDLGKPSLFPVIIGLKFGMGLNQEFVNGPDQWFVDLREKNDKIYAGPGFGISLRISGMRGFQYEMGAEHQNIGISYGSPGELSIIRYDSIPVYDQFGNLIKYLRYDYREEKLSEEPKRAVMTYLSIPVAVNKSFALGSAVKLYAGVEIRSRFLLKASGTSVNHYYKVFSLHKQNLSPVGFSAGLNLGMNYYLTENYLIDFSIGSQMDINNQSTLPGLEQRFGVYKAQIGLYYRIR